jgi:regulation of enolase protein 1 (concanavalin A-like superfamily)
MLNRLEIYMLKSILIPALALTSALFADPAPGNQAAGPSWETLDRQNDFIPAPKSTRSFSALAQAAPAAAENADGSTVTYASWYAGPHIMRQFNGKYTALLLKQAALDAVGIARVRKIIDEQDIVYEAYRTLVGSEPAGTGLLKVAIVDSTCGAGCAHVGQKGIELNWDVVYLPDYLFFVIHEMGHDYDGYHDALYGGADPAHAWTMFFDNYIKLYLGLSYNGMNATDFFHFRLRKVFEPYETFPGSTWSQCISGRNCDPVGIVDALGLDVGAQGGLVMRIVELYGTSSITGWLGSVRTLLAQRAAPPATDLDRAELFMESLSMTVKANLSCVFDQLRWPVGTAVRNRMAQYGAASAFCADADFDGYTRLNHDCNDASASVHPGAVETVNGVDDDCDGVKDDLLVKETTGFPHAPLSAQTVPMPVRITGNVPTTSDQDIDCLQFTLPAADSIWFTLVSKGIFDGYLQIREPVQGVEIHAEHVYAGDFIPYKMGLPAGKSIACLYAYGVPGDYELDISKAYPYPMAEDLAPITFTPAAAVSPSAGSFLIPIPAIPSALAGRTGLTTHFWISGAGEVGSIASTSTTPFPWTAPAGSNPAASTYRVDFHSGGIPVQSWSQHQSLPGSVGWISQDVGPVNIPGAFAKFGEQDVSMTGSGADIWGTQDGFRFAYQPLNGNGDVVARLLTLQNSNAITKAGVMIRETLAAGSKNVLMSLAQDGLARFQNRAATGGVTVSAKVASAVPLWVKLSRKGDVFTAFTSPDGAAWTQIGTATVPMAASLYAGLAVTSHDNNKSAVAGFSNARVIPAPGLPAPWVTQNIGAVGPVGDASMSGGVLTVNGSGADIWGTADAFRYVYFPMAGNAQLIAQVTSLQNTNAFAKAGVMIRENTTAGSANALMAVTAASGVTFQTRTASGAVSTSIKTAGAVPTWVRITRVGSLFTGYVSSNGTAWTLVGSKTISMATNVLVGVAVTSHDNTVAAKATVQALNPN